MTFRGVALPLILFLVSCDSAERKRSLNSASRTPAAPLKPASELAAPQLPDLPELGDEEAGAFAAASNDFGLKLFRQMGQREAGNFCISPLSVSLALAMGTAGARGETEEEMSQLLGWDGRLKALSNAQHWLEDWHRADSTLQVTQGLFGQQNAEFEPEYLAIVEQVFRSPLERLNFAGAPEPSRQRINTWVADATNRRIPELIAPGAISRLTRLVLVNALHYQGQWERAFSKKNTKKERFRPTKSKTVKVEMMNARTKFGYAYVGAAHLLDIPYDDGLSMTLILPWKSHRLREVEKQLDSATLAEWIAKLEEHTVRVSVPRFTLQGGTQSLRKPLQELGMKRAFSEDSADFAGIASPNPVPLYLSDVLHQTYVRVDEEGTEAAAATALVVSVAVSAGRSPGGYYFTADEPFLFVIRDPKSAAILFLGRVNDPTKS